MVEMMIDFVFCMRQKVIKINQFYSIGCVESDIFMW